MRDYEELVRELRDCRNKAVFSEYWWNITSEAADAIEELCRENESLANSVNEAAEILRNRSSKWISVEERLPEGDCLVYEANRGRVFSAAKEEAVESADWCVTHWMPLPSAPTEE